MIRRHFDILLLFVLASIVVFQRLAGVETGFFTKFTGAVFVLFAPGYAVMAAVFREGVLEAPAKIALGIGLSMAVSAIGGIGLYGTHALLTQTSWTIFLTLVILSGGLVAVFQRSRNTSYTPKYINRKIAFSELLLLMFSVLILSVGVYVALFSDLNQAYVPFTEFWVVPQADDESKIEVGLHNYERANMVYDISFRINGREVETWPNVIIQPDQEWRRTYATPPKVTNYETIAIYLYKDEDPSKPYRWIQIHR